MRRNLKVKKISIRKSCDLCNRRKKKCDGDGVNRCSLCIEKGQAHCVYSPRQPQRPRKPKTDASVGRGSQWRPNPNPLSLVTSSQAAGMQQSFKRFRVAPSPATGLVGTEENQLLFDFFGCMGFLPLTCQQTVREAMVKVLAQAWSPQSDRSALLFEDPGTGSMEGTLIPFSDKQAFPKDDPADPSSCMFWCAIALGGLAVGRPFSRVVTYVDRARSALNGGPGAPTADIARAWAVMAYLYGFCGNTESFLQCQRRAEIYLKSSAEEELTEQEEFKELVRHAWGLGIFYGESARAEDLEEFLDQYEESHPQPPQAITQRNICLFVFQSYRRFGQAFLTDLRENGAGVSIEAGPEVGGLEALEEALVGGENSYVVGLGNDGPGTQMDESDYIAELGAQLLSEDDDLQDGTADVGGLIAAGGGVGLSEAWGCNGAVARSGGVVGGLPDVVVLTGEEAIEPPAVTGNLEVMMKQAVPAYDALIRAVDMPQIRNGIGGLMINCSLVVLKAAQTDFAGSIERISRCVEVLVKYPGMCRFPMAMHISHLLLCGLVAMENRDLYEVLRGAYNPMAPPGTVPIPPFEEWQGIAPCCRHVYCRAIEESFQRIRNAKNQAVSTANHSSMVCPDYLVPSRTVPAAPMGGDLRRASVVSDNSVAERVEDGCDSHGAVIAAGVKEATDEAVQSLSPRSTGLKGREELDTIATAAEYGFQVVSKSVAAVNAAASAPAYFGSAEAFEGSEAGMGAATGAVLRKASASNGAGICFSSSSGLGTTGNFLAAAPGSLAFEDGDGANGPRGESTFVTSVKGHGGMLAVVANGDSGAHGAGTCIVGNGAGVAGGLALRDSDPADRFGSVEGRGMAPAVFANGSSGNSRSVNGSVSGSSCSAMLRKKREDIGETELYNFPDIAEIADMAKYVDVDLEEAMGMEKFIEDLDMMAAEQPRRNAGVVG